MPTIKPRRYTREGVRFALVAAILCHVGCTGWTNFDSDAHADAPRAVQAVITPDGSVTAFDKFHGGSREFARIVGDEVRGYVKGVQTSIKLTRVQRIQFAGNNRAVVYVVVGATIVAALLAVAVQSWQTGLPEYTTA